MFKNISSTFFKVAAIAAAMETAAAVKSDHVVRTKAPPLSKAPQLTEREMNAAHSGDLDFLREREGVINFTDSDNRSLGHYAAGGV